MASAPEALFLLDLLHERAHQLAQRLRVAAAVEPGRSVGARHQPRLDELARVERAVAVGVVHAKQLAAVRLVGRAAAAALGAQRLQLAARGHRDGRVREPAP